MTLAEKHLVASYSKLLEGLSDASKSALIQSLSTRKKKEKKIIEEDFYQSFGAFETDKSAEEILKEIKESRTFRAKKITF